MMTQTTDTKFDAELDAFFDAAKQADPAPSGAFFETAFAAAQTQTDLRAAEKQRQPEPTNDGFIAKLLSSLGGWQAASALAACACLGVFMGYSTPDTLDYINGSQVTADTLNGDSFSVALDIETLFQEG